MKIINQHSAHKTCRITTLVATVAVLTSAALHASASDPKTLFSAKCASCHGADGSGQTAIGKKWGIKDLRASKLTEAEIKRQINEGKSDPAKGSNMPPFNDKLEPDEISSLAGYVIELRKK